MGTYLVLGGTGKTGRRVVDRLAAAGHEVRAAARTPSGDAAGVTPVRFDWDDVSTHDAALAGAEAVYLVTPALRLVSEPVVTPFLARAAAAGVSRVVLLSARGVDMAPESPLGQVEQAVRESGMEWTILRPSWFDQNFTEGAFAPGVAEGTLAAPAGEGTVPFVDVDDVADVAVVALTTGRLSGRGIDLSGPRALSFGEAAEIISEATGRSVTYVDVPSDAYFEALTGFGLPDDYAAVLIELLGYVKAGQDSHLSDGVPEVLGRPATSFEDWAAKAL